MRLEPDRLPKLCTRSHPDVRGRLEEALVAHAHDHPGVAASVRDVVEQLARAGCVRHRDTIADWLQ